MPSSMHSKSYFSYKQIQNPATLLSLLRQTATADSGEKRVKSRRRSGGILKMFKLIPLLTSGSKMAALLGRVAAGIHQKNLIADHATIGTILSHRRGGKVTIAIQESAHGSPAFVIDLPIFSPAFQREMEGDILRVAFESERKKSNNKKLLEEMVWAVYCNGRKIGYSVRRKEMSEEEAQVMRLLKGVSMGAGVLPYRRPEERGESPEGEMTYLRARFERVVGSSDSQAMYMINPDGSHDGPELSIFFLRVR